MVNEIMGQELRGLFEEIVREEVRRALTVHQAHSCLELITDPASKELSMSRLAMGVLVLDMTAILALAASGLLNPEKLSPITTMFSGTVASVAAIYGLNSFAGAGSGNKVQEVWEKVKGHFAGRKAPASPDPDSTANKVLSAAE
jgi:hypothetical protein